MVAFLKKCVLKRAKKIHLIKKRIGAVALSIVNKQPLNIQHFLKK